MTTTNVDRDGIGKSCTLFIIHIQTVENVLRNNHMMGATFPKFGRLLVKIS